MAAKAGPAAWIARFVSDLILAPSSADVLVEPPFSAANEMSRSLPKSLLLLESQSSPF